MRACVSGQQELPTGGHEGFGDGYRGQRSLRVWASELTLPTWARRPVTTVRRPRSCWLSFRASCLRADHRVATCSMFHAVVGEGVPSKRSPARTTAVPLDLAPIKATGSCLGRGRGSRSIHPTAVSRTVWPSVAATHTSRLTKGKSCPSRPVWMVSASERDTRSIRYTTPSESVGPGADPQRWSWTPTTSRRRGASDRASASGL